MPNNTIEQKGSSTAEYTCLARAFATREKVERFRGPDTMAEFLFPLKAKLMLNIPIIRSFIIKKIFPPGIYEYICARTKVIDEVFIQALNRDYKQIVLLGAGYDTRALRFAAKNHGTHIYEVDAPTTQRLKQKQLKRKGIDTPKELTFIPVDFNRQSLAEALYLKGYQDNLKTLFIWEGVTMYITAEAVDNTLAFIHKSSSAESIVAFDYAYASVIRGEKRYYGEKEIISSVSNAGEVWTFGIEEGAIRKFLSERGFKLVTEYTPLDLQKEYLTTEDGTQLGTINGTQSIVLAERT